MLPQAKRGNSETTGRLSSRCTEKFPGRGIPVDVAVAGTFSIVVDVKWLLRFLHRDYLSVVMFFFAQFAFMAMVFRFLENCFSPLIWRRLWKVFPFCIIVEEEKDCSSELPIQMRINLVVLKITNCMLRHDSSSGNVRICSERSWCCRHSPCLLNRDTMLKLSQSLYLQHEWRRWSIQAQRCVLKLSGIWNNWKKHAPILNVHE
jgi:hypothetical protein